jgi:hypothetical protein
MGPRQYDSERTLDISRALFPARLLLLLARNLVRYRVSDHVRWPDALLLVGAVLLVAVCALRLRYDDWGPTARVAWIVIGTTMVALAVVSVLGLTGVIAPL